MKQSHFTFLLTICIFCIGHLLLAQVGSISGTIYGQDEELLPFSNVLLLQEKDSVFVKGTTSTEEGDFVLENVAKGKYVIAFSFLGFDTYYHSLEVTSSKEISLGNINLVATSQSLQTVELLGQKALFVQKSDRLIVNVGDLPTFSGNNALQILQKSPGVVVQENANSISLNNKGEVLIMINDRISRVPTSVLIQQLKALQAENIDRIEIIHQPSAKYDSNNAAGMIHIVMKENQMEGINGTASLTAGMGQRGKLNGSLDMNYRNKRFNLYGNLTGFQNNSPMQKVDHFREYEYEGHEYYYENKLVFTNPTSRSLGFTLGADFEISENQVVGGIFGYTVGGTRGDDFTSTSRGSINNAPDNKSEFLLDINNPKINSFANLNYHWKLNPSSSINLDVDRVSLDVENFSSLSYLDAREEIDQTEVFRDSRFEIYALQGDYEYKTKNDFKVGVGLKGTFNTSNSVSQSQSRISGTWVTNESFFRNDGINENILAAYGSAQKKWSDKWESTFGARLERYTYDLSAVNEDDDFINTYTNLFPVVRSTYSINSKQTLTVSYNRRIERPAFMQLAGYYALIDPSLFVSSNTRIRPSFTNALRFAYNHRSLLLAFEINRTAGAISFYNTVDKEKNLQTSTPINFDSMHGYLLSVNFPILVGESWKMNWNLDAAHKMVKDTSNRPLPFEKGLFTVTAQLTNVLELGKSWTANVDARYMSPFIAGDQVLYLRYYVNIGVSKKFQNQSSLTLSIQDITATGGIIDWEYHQPELGIRTFGQNNWSERVFQVTYSLPFGNQKVKGKRMRETGSKVERDRM